jgi:hypothetical protein
MTTMLDAGGNFVTKKSQFVILIFDSRANYIQ